jgi:hypothetical protein
MCVCIVFVMAYVLWDVGPKSTRAKMTNMFCVRMHVKVLPPAPEKRVSKVRKIANRNGLEFER